MKNILIALSSVAVMLLSSCGKDFITVRHNSSEPLAEYFINEERMYQGLMAAYDPLEWFDYFYQYNNLNFVSDIMADDIYCGGSNEGDQPILVKTHYFTATSIDCCNQIWTIAYSGINRACVVLEYVDGVPGMSDQTKARYKAEATVLKAYYYTLLWKFWGNIPYYDKNLETPYLTAQLGHDEVYEKIVTRLQEAIDMNILPMKVAAGEEGRVSLAMAYMLYAEAVMYQNDQTRYQTALDYMKEIISAGSYSLVDDYAGIWLESGEWCAESIWEINYTSEGGVRSWDSPIATGGTVYPILIGIAGCSTTFSDGWGFGPVAASAYEMYEEGDIRRDGGILNWDKFAAETGATPRLCSTQPSCRCCSVRTDRRTCSWCATALTAPIPALRARISSRSATRSSSARVSATGTWCAAAWLRPFLRRPTTSIARQTGPSRRSTGRYLSRSATRIPTSFRTTTNGV